MDNTNNTTTATKEKPEPKLVDIPITSENMALNVIISFVSLAQRRGVFSIEESAKIWECIKKFQKPEASPNTKEKDI